MSKRVLAVVVCLAILICTAPANVFARGDVYNISSADDFLEFAKGAKLDTEFEGKTVNLICDIDFKGTDFVSVPIFAGTFNGNGHTISGIDIDKSGSFLGVFRYLKSGASVKDLNVEGNYTPSGTKNCIGGIVGENSGSVINCTFNGHITGEEAVGGIAGKNTETGIINSCITRGTVVGQSKTGGIAGENYGTIMGSENNCHINTVITEESEKTFNIPALNPENEDEKLIYVAINTGGIAGFSSGIISGCTNNASIGYESVGYNIGGIAGIMSGGLIINCQNNGKVTGRRDVGGICGQFEPDITLNDTSSDLEGELSILRRMVDDTISDLDSSSDIIKQHLDIISDKTDSAVDSAKILSDGAYDFINDNLDEINSESIIISDYLSDISIAIDYFAASSDAADEALRILSDTLNEIDDNELKKASKDIRKSVNLLSSAFSDLKNAVKKLQKAVTIHDTNATQKALEDIVGALNKIQNNHALLKSAVDTLANAESFAEFKDTLVKISNYISKTSDSIDTIISSVNIVLSNTEINLDSFKSGTNYMSSAFADLSKSMDYLESALDILDIELGESTFEGLRNSVSSLSYAVSKLKDGMYVVSDATAEFTSQEPLEFVLLDDEFKEAGNSLYNSAQGIGSELDLLIDDFSQSGKTLSKNLKDINNQFYKIMTILIDDINRLSSDLTGFDLNNYITDISDENIENTNRGKIKNCTNFGDIYADINVGGIAGSMAIENIADPEVDIEKPSTLFFVYETKAIVQSSVNNGSVASKKNCSGGICGNMDLGTIYQSENYGEISSEDGNYTGGIAGKSNSSIIKSYAKCTVSGNDYVGAVAGKADIVRSCYAIGDVSGTEYVGAIAGKADNLNKIISNYYIGEDLGGIDDISYKGKSEAVTYEDIIKTPSIPARFLSLEVKFVADDKTIKTEYVKYGQEYRQIPKPQIPEKSDSYGVWEEHDGGPITTDIKITADYKDWITLLESDETDGDGKLALCLAEGKFTQDSKLSAEIIKMDNLPVKGAVTYKITLQDKKISDRDIVPIRILNANKDRVKVWRLRGDEWVQTDSKNRGKYISLDMEGKAGVFCIAYSASYMGIVIGGIIILILALAAVVFFILKKKNLIKFSKKKQ